MVLQSPNNLIPLATIILEETQLPLYLGSIRINYSIGSVLFLEKSRQGTLLALIW